METGVCGALPVNLWLTLSVPGLVGADGVWMGLEPDNGSPGPPPPSNIVSESC